LLLAIYLKTNSVSGKREIPTIDNRCPLTPENMQTALLFSGESNDPSAADALVKETTALNLDPRNRVIVYGSDSL
jgi:hypothetical protein